MFTSGVEKVLEFRGASRMRLAALVSGVLLAVSILALAPSLASAAIRYTTPTGSGTACTQALPCSLSQGVSGAVAGDEVSLTADEYYLSGDLPVDVPNLTISGPPGRYAGAEAFRAFIFFTDTSSPTPRLRVRKPNFTLARVSIVYDGPAAAIRANTTFTGPDPAPGMTLNRVRVSSNGGTAVTGSGVSIVNSVIQQASIGGNAVDASGSIVGSTIISRGIAIENNASDHAPPYCDLSIRNTIGVGTSSNLTTGNAGSSCRPNTSFENSWIPGAAGFGGGGIDNTYGFITRGPGNLPDNPPALPDPFSGILEPALGSPAIDAGCTAGCGTEDFYGRPRPIGPANDIGAYEAILPPTISTVGVDSKTFNLAELSATINPNGGATTWNFQIRKAGATDWESVQGATTGEGTTPETVSTTAQPLDANTSYEVRVVGLNSTGIEVASPAVTAFATDPAPPTVSIGIRSAKATVSRKKVTVRAKVRTSAPGRITVRATTGRGGSKTWCKVTKRVRAAGGHTLDCNLGRKGRAKIRKAPLKLMLRAGLTADSGLTASGLRKLTIPRKR